MSKYNHDKCDKPEKDLFHGVCKFRQLLKNTCDLDGKKCKAYKK